MQHRRRLKFCMRCNQRTTPDVETDPGRCSECFGPYSSGDPRVLPFPPRLRIVRRDDDFSPPEAA